VATSRSALPAAFEDLELNPLDENGIQSLLETRGWRSTATRGDALDRGSSAR
ncbi:MAG: hypothetical protein HC933_16790, partial [Pleurocapsa sp. SU_196_0]|nr:hypothetical protein [Pleurocapsa sp. SU_196_0]